MKPTLVSLTLATLFGVAFGADAATRCFTLREKVDVDDEPIGYYRVTAKVSGSAEARLVSFSVTLPDSPQTLLVPPTRAQRKARGYAFRFVDGWGNQGSADLVIAGRRATLVLQELEVAEGGNNILRNYGTYELKEAACRR